MVRVSDTRRIEQGVTGSLAVVVYERMSGIVALLVFALLASLLKIRFVKELPLLYVSLLVSLAGILLLMLAWKKLPRGFLAGRECRRPWLRKLLDKLDAFHGIILDFVNHRVLSRKVFFWAMLLQFNVVLHYFLIGRALHLDRIPLLDYFFSIPIMLFVLSLPDFDQRDRRPRPFPGQAFHVLRLSGPVRHRLFAPGPGVQPAAGHRRRRDLHLPQKMKKKARAAFRRAAACCSPATRRSCARSRLKIQEISAKLQASKQDKSSILNDIYALELQTETAVIELNRVNLLMDDAQAQIAAKQKEEAALQAKIRYSQDNVRRILRVLYKMGELGYVKLFININSLDQLFRNYRLIVSLMDDKVMEIRAIRVGLAQLQKIKAELQAELDRLAGLKEQKAGKLARLKGLKQEKLDMIARINRQRDLNSRLLDELKIESENLTRILDQKTMASVADAVDLGPLRGKLAWPLGGTVISSFGKKKSAKFNTYTMNNGIEIKPERSDEIRAVGGGRGHFLRLFARATATCS